MIMTCPKDKGLIHKFQIDGKKFVVDVNSIASFRIDNLTWDILDLCDSESNNILVEELSRKYSKQDIIDALEQMGELEQEGLLFSEDKLKHYTPPKAGESELGALCLSVADTCNLRCKYCHANFGAYGYDKLVSRMSKETAKNAIDFLIDKSGSEKNLDISFFGGEPLLNFEVIKFGVEYAKQRGIEGNKHFSFGVTTNGLLLTEEVQEFLNREIFFVIISLDGPRDVHDKYRVFANSAGSYDIIVPKIQRFIASRNGTGVSIRASFTHETLGIYEIIKHLADDLGFQGISVEPTYTPRESDFYITEEDILILKNEYKRVAYWYLNRIKEGKSFDFFYFRRLIEQIHSEQIHITECGAGHSYLGISPNGDIYACHWFPSMPQYKMGNVNIKDYDVSLEGKYASVWVGAKEKCKACWAKYICGGGCMTYAAFYNDDILKPYSLYCEHIKNLIELGVMLYDALLENNLLEAYWWNSSHRKGKN